MTEPRISGPWGSQGWPTNLTGTETDLALGSSGRGTKVTLPDPLQGSTSEVGMAFSRYLVKRT